MRSNVVHGVAVTELDWRY